MLAWQTAVPHYRFGHGLRVILLGKEISNPIKRPQVRLSAKIFPWGVYLENTQTTSNPERWNKRITRAKPHYHRLYENFRLCWPTLSDGHMSAVHPRTAVLPQCPQIGIVAAESIVWGHWGNCCILMAYNTISWNKSLSNRESLSTRLLQPWPLGGTKEADAEKPVLRRKHLSRMADEGYQLGDCGGRQAIPGTRLLVHMKRYVS